MSRRQSFHQTFYLLGLIAVAVAMPLSHFLMGLACFLLFLNWLFEWNWQEKQRLFSQNREGVWFSLFYLIYAIGLVNVTDWGAAGKEMLSKLPFLLAPIIVITSKPLKIKQLQLGHVKPVFHILQMVFRKMGTVVQIRYMTTTVI